LSLNFIKFLIKYLNRLLFLSFFLIFIYFLLNKYLYIMYIYHTPFMCVSQKKIFFWLFIFFKKIIFCSNLKDIYLKEFQINKNKIFFIILYGQKKKIFFNKN